MSWKDILKGEEVHPSVRGYIKDRDTKIERQRPKDDKTLFQLDVMNRFRDFAIRVIGLNFSGRTDMRNEKGEIKMPLTISVIQLLKKYRNKEHYLGDAEPFLITPAEFIEKERKLAEVIIDQIVDTLKVFPKSEDIEAYNPDDGYTPNFVRYAKSKLPRLSVSMVTD